MAFQDDPHRIVWRVFIASPPETVYDFLDTDEGRARFWAESAAERDGAIAFVFPDGTEIVARVLERRRPEVFSLDYFGSVATFRLASADGGTEVVLEHAGVPPHERAEVMAGWVSVLMQLKAAAQFGVDLRNHSATRHWGTGYADN